MTAKQLNIMFIISDLHQINVGKKIATNVDWQTTICASLFRELSCYVQVVKFSLSQSGETKDCAQFQGVECDFRAF